MIDLAKMCFLALKMVLLSVYGATRNENIKQVNWEIFVFSAS